jgi:peptidoglycan/LPS O-acetylase OafA/YrhL
VPHVSSPEHHLAADVVPAQRSVDAPDPTVWRVDALTGIRFLGMLVVFLAHANYTLMPVAYRGWLGPLVEPARVWVSFFFLLSGFVMCWSHSERNGARAFYLRRFARIYPAYLVARLGGLLIAMVGSGTTVLKFVLALFLLQSWVPDSTYYFSFPGVSWSLSVEAFMYLSFPFALGFLVHMGRRTRRYVAVVCIIVPLVLAAFAQANYSALGYVDLPNNNTTWLAAYLPLSRLPEFILGVIMALELRERGRAPLPYRFAAPLFLSIYTYCAIWPSFFTQFSLTVGPLALLLASVAEREQQGGVTWLRGRRIVFLGDVSYCFYLTHTLVGLVMLQIPAFHSVLGVGLFFVVALTGAILLHKLVERPANKALLRFFKVGRSARPA